MAIRQPGALQRAFPRRDALRGAARMAALWSLLAALLLCGVLLVLFLLADLLVTRGELRATASAADLTSLNRASGEEFPISAELVANPERTESKWMHDTGILPTVWWSRDRWWGPAVAFLYRTIPTLRDNYRALLTLLVLGALLALLRALLLSRVRTLSRRAGVDVASRLRRSLHRQALRIGPGDLEETEAQHAFHLFTTEVDRIRRFVQRTVYHAWRYPAEIVVLIGTALAIHPLLAVEWLIPLGLCWFLLRTSREKSEVDLRSTEEDEERQLRVLAEGLFKARLVRGYGMENVEHEQFQTHLERHGQRLLARRGSRRGIGRPRWLARGAWYFLLLFLLFLLAGKLLAHPDELSLAGGIAFIAAFVLMFRPAEELRELQNDRAAASESAAAVFRYLDRIPAVGQAVGARFLQPLSESLQYESVSYALPDGRKLLEGLDLKLPAGKSIAFVSLDPLEARAAAYMLPRFVEPQSGRVRFDGEDTAWVTLESLRAESIYVGGSDPLLNGTVLENIRCGNAGLTLQQATDAAKQTHAHHFILRLAQGYETPLGEYGERLQPGQAFRLGLARAIVRNPALLIVEEPQIPLDEDTKSLLDDAYNRIVKNRTVVFLPARVSTLRRADLIVMIHKGKVEAVGPHATLVKESAVYRHWEYVRFNEFRRIGESSAAT